MNSPQRNLDTSSQNSTLGNGRLDLSPLNLSSVEEIHQGIFLKILFSRLLGFSQNRNTGKRLERINPVIKRRTRSSRPRQFMNDLITFDPQITN